MCCSRCHGLLLEGFLQIVSLQQKGSKDRNNNNSAVLDATVNATVDMWKLTNRQWQRTLDYIRKLRIFGQKTSQAYMLVRSDLMALSMATGMMEMKVTHWILSSLNMFRL
ncbi:unnamed protein product [Eruca vesicaria subsp. sativa]|uniref:Uncharacterized protein n=1 Tax=Eruca vesicaria subsp. sativa TaxID=29727 RepID=A0ABC8LTH3_ERUVS|nr:unnamed protein product [Eruca vesicaria subsp. sativa]